MIIMGVLMVLTVLFFVVEVVFGKKLDSIKFSQWLRALFPSWALRSQGGAAFSNSGGQLGKAINATLNSWIITIWILGVITAALGFFFYIILSRQYDNGLQTFATDSITGIVTAFLGFIAGRVSKGK